MTFQPALRQASNPFLTLANWPKWRSIEARRAALLKSTTIVEDIDYGAGDPKHPRSIEEQKRGVVAFARAMSVSVLFGETKAANVYT
jgi:hypothetical protein